MVIERGAGGSVLRVSEEHSEAGEALAAAVSAEHLRRDGGSVEGYGGGARGAVAGQRGGRVRLLGFALSRVFASIGFPSSAFVDLFSDSTALLFSNLSGMSIV